MFKFAFDRSAIVCVDIELTFKYFYNIVNLRRIPKIVVVGSINTDMVIRTPHLPRPGETVLGGEFMMNAGGKGANQAVAVHRLGADLTFIAKVGNDVFGRNTLDQFGKAGINTEYIGVSEHEASGVALINVDDEAENCIAVASGANLALSPLDIEAASFAISEADIMLLQLEIPMETVIYAAKLAKKHGLKVVLNPAPAPAHPLPEELLCNVDILIPNRTEMECVAGVQEGADPIKTANMLAANGIETIVVTLGSKGSLVYQGGKCEEIQPFPVIAIDTTAAGDTFCGALCVALAEGADIKEAALFGNLAASITVTREGAQQAIPTREEVEELAHEKGVKLKFTDMKSVCI